eukprot:6174833-Pleurochrysis_carterae.AAC.1
MRSILAFVQLIDSACTLALDADESFYDHVYATLFGIKPFSRNHAAPRPPRPTCNEAPANTCRRVEPCPATLRMHARALYASHRRRHSGKHQRGLAPGLRSVGFIVDSGCSWH